MITNSLFLDVSRKEIKSITVCQGDQNSRVWNVYFSNGGTQLDLSTITSISIYMRKPDGNFIYNPCQIDLDNNCAILTFDEQMCLVSGVGTLQMSMYTYDEINNSLEVLYTFAIKVIISESSIPTLYPILFNFLAINAVTVDFPTPPFPLITAIIFFILLFVLFFILQVAWLLQLFFDGHELQFDIYYSSNLC